MDKLVNNQPLNIVREIAGPDPWGESGAFTKCSGHDAMLADVALTTKEGAAEVAKILRGDLDGPSVCDMILLRCEDSMAYNHLAAGVALSAIAACRERPSLMLRACEVGQAMVDAMSPHVAEAFHRSAIFEMAVLSQVQPKAKQACADFLYPALAGAIQKRGSMIGDGFFDMNRDPAMTPAGMAAICDFKPAIERLAAQSPASALQSHFRRLANAVKDSDHAEIAIPNIKASWQTIKAEAVKDLPVSKRSDPSAKRNEGLQEWVQ